MSEKQLFFVIVCVLILGFRFVWVQTTFNLNENQNTESGKTQFLQQKEEVENDLTVKFEKYKFQLNENLNTIYDNLNVTQNKLRSLNKSELLNANERIKQINHVQK